MMSGRLVRRGLVLVALAVSFAAGAVVTRAADPRLDDAHVALEKAEGLLLAAQEDSGDAHIHHEFQRHVNRALELIGRALEQIQEAKDAVDNP